MASYVPPKKSTSFDLGVTLYTSSGALIASPSSVSAEVAYDFGHFNVVPSSDIVIADSTRGLIQIRLESSHMAYDAVSVFVDDDTANMVPFTATIYTSAHRMDDPYSSSRFTDAFWTRTGIIGVGTAQNTASTSITLASTQVGNSDDLNGAVVFISSGTGFGQSRQIVNYDSTAKLASVDAWVTTPSSVCDYLVFTAPPASAESLPSVNLTQIAGVAVSPTVAQLGVHVVSIDTNAITGEAVSDAAVTKISSGLATSTEVSSGFAAQTAALSTMASAVSSLSGWSTLTAAQAADAVLNSTVDGTYTLRQIQRGVASVLMGKVSGSSGSTTVFRDINDAKARITALTDTSGNRTAITVDLT
jgi:hypothetical protein